MTKGEETQTAILDSAERMARIGGFRSFSFREIAKDVGIKAASVHYHFPGKDDLGAAIARRYTDQFIENLGDPAPADTTLLLQLERYVQAYRKSLVDDDLMCLCGMLGAEVQSLPVSLQDEVRRFFEKNIDWLTTIFDESLTARSKNQPGGESKTEAQHLIATLEGAMIIARSLGEPKVFDDIMAKALAELATKFD